MADAEYDKTQVLSRPPGGEKPSAVAAELRCVDTSVLRDGAGARIVLDGESVTIGRGGENDVRLDAHGVSRRHARLFLAGGAWQVEDLGSTNGTRVNNSRIERRALEHGDTVAFGRVCYKFRIEQPGAQRAAAVDIDLGGAQRTVILRPSERPVPAQAPQPAPAAPAPAATPAAPRPQPGAAAPAATGAATPPAAVPAAPRKPPAAAASPSASEQIYDSGKHRRVAPPPAQRSEGGTWIWIGVLVVALAALLAAAYFLGLI